MGQKTSPISMRLGFSQDWRSRYFANRELVKYLKDDVKIRGFLEKKLRFMSVSKVEIERTTGQLKVIIYTSRPGLIIGRGGSGIEDLKKEIDKLLAKTVPVRLEIQEYKSPETSAAIMAEQIIERIERRIPFRRIMKQAVSKIASHREVKGVKVELKGRLDGAEIARTEHMGQGPMPLQTLTADIDFAKNTAYTTYGTVGVKVWIYRNGTSTKKD
ncbi:MAG: small subunit ribosomal protein S3 [Parcubacteria group bacterium Gr01-1014_2]|nr:MAG: small subunit ribosomal protein S3 [Parcubacteria group bacterium Gr01-1014_2]